MIVEYGGGNSGIAEYLEKGGKQGRIFSRDELDRRVVLDGDLSLTNTIINSIQDNGQERYLHITLSFKESEIDNDTLTNIVADYKQILMSSYSDDEFNFYAEAHLPKIKHIQDNKTGELIERKPHIHIVIPEVNLLSFNKLLPTGLIKESSRYLDSIQESINYKYNLESPKDNIRNADMHSANVLSRIKGDFFGEKQQAVKSLLVDEIAANKINSMAEFQNRLSDFGEVKIRNKGKPTQYFAVKMGDDKKFTNLNHPIFQAGFIVDKALPSRKPSLDEVTANVADWQKRVSREIKFVHFATPSFRKKYAAANAEEKAALLLDRELNYERKYRSEERSVQSSGRTRNNQPNLDFTQKRESSIVAREAGGVSSLPDSTLVHGKNQRSGSVEGVLPENEQLNLRNRKPRNHSTLRRIDPSRTGIDGRVATAALPFKFIKKGLPTRKFSLGAQNNAVEHCFNDFLTEFDKLQRSQPKSLKFSDSNVVSQVAKNLASAKSSKDDLQLFAEIRKNIDPDIFLKHLENVYSIKPTDYKVSYAKDGSPRFNVGKRNLNASDFLTKHLNLEWQEAKQVLFYVYERQANKNVNQARVSTLDVQRNIKSFTFEMRQFKRDFELALHNMNVENRNLFKGEKKRIYARATDPKILKQELAIASFRAMQRQERINEFERVVSNSFDKSKIVFQQGGYSQQSLENSIMGFADAFNIALGNEYGRISAADEKISFTENFKRQQELLKRQLQEQQTQSEKSSEQRADKQAYQHKALEEVLKKNELGVAKKKNGDIEYKRLSDGKTLCTDIGTQMYISKDMQSKENVRTFLELAIDKYGNELKVSGSKEYKEMIVDVAAANNLPVILKPAELQEQLMARRKELQLEAQAESVDSLSNEAQAHIDREPSEQKAEAAQEAQAAEPSEQKVETAQELSDDDLKMELMIEEMLRNGPPESEHPKLYIDELEANIEERLAVATPEDKLLITKVFDDIKEFNESFENYHSFDVGGGVYDYGDWDYHTANERYDSQIDYIKGEMAKNDKYSNEILEQIKGTESSVGAALSALKNEVSEAKSEINSDLSSLDKLKDVIENGKGWDVRNAKEDMLEKQFEVFEKIRNDKNYSVVFESMQEQHGMRDIFEKAQGFDEKHNEIIADLTQIENLNNEAHKLSDEQYNATYKSPYDEKIKSVADQINAKVSEVKEKLMFDVNYEKAYSLAEKSFNNKKESIVDISRPRPHAKTYDVSFKFDQKTKKYNISVNGVSARDVIKSDPYVLKALKEHPDMKKHNVPLNELKDGAITRTDSMKGANNRPKDLTLSGTEKVQQQVKQKDQGMER